MKRTKLLMTLLACVFLSGCMKLRLRLDVSPKGTVDETASFLLDTELLQLSGDDLDESLESMRVSMLEENPDAQVEIVKEENEEGKVTYAGVSVRQENTEEFTTTVKNRRVTIEIPVEKVMNDVGTTIGEEDVTLEELKEAGFEVTMDVNMPEVPETNFGTVEGKTVRIDLLAIPAGTDTIIISSKTGEMNPFVIGAILGGIALGAGFYFVQNNNKKNTAAAREENRPQFTSDREETAAVPTENDAFEPTASVLIGDIAPEEAETEESPEEKRPEE